MYNDIILVCLGIYGVILAIGFMVLNSVKLEKFDVDSQILHRIYASMQGISKGGNKLKLDEIRSIDANLESATSEKGYAFPFIKNAQCNETEMLNNRQCENTILLENSTVQDTEIISDMCKETELLTN